MKREAPANGDLWNPAASTWPLVGRTQQVRAPIKLMVSLIDKCNLRCFHCLGSTTKAPPEVPAKPATRELIDFIADRIMPEVTALRLGGLGCTEQLIAPEFDYFIERMRPYHLQHFQLTTNLSVMNPRRADLLASNLTEIETSIEGVGENFKWARKMSWDRFRTHFEMLRDAKLRNPASRMKLGLLVCVVPRMMDDLLRFDLFKEMGVEKIVLREMEVLAPELEEHRLDRTSQRTQDFIAAYKKGAAAANLEYGLTFDGIAPESAIGFRKCAMPFETLSITSDGGFGTCCKLPAITYPGGRPIEWKIQDLWNRREFQELRASVNSRRPLEICKNCEIKIGHLTYPQQKELFRKLETPLGKLAATGHLLRFSNLKTRLALSEATQRLLGNPRIDQERCGK